MSDRAKKNVTNAVFKLCESNGRINAYLDENLILLSTYSSLADRNSALSLHSAWLLNRLQVLTVF